MAGSYGHITNDSGGFIGTHSLDHLGDAYEALEECFGMIWWLADRAAGCYHHGSPRTATREQILDFIEAAKKNYRDGLNFSEENMKVSAQDPDHINLRKRIERIERWIDKNDPAWLLKTPRTPSSDDS